ncbi:MAG TPA: hypothetical protein QF753_14475 [Victivallales bacterium]|nr:hypothetical protein [Victivallales bacterium]
MIKPTLIISILLLYFTCIADSNDTAKIYKRSIEGINYALKNFGELITDDNGEEFEAYNYRVSKCTSSFIVISRNITDENMRKEGTLSDNEDYTIHYSEVDTARIKVRIIDNINGADIIAGKNQVTIPGKSENCFEIKRKNRNPKIEKVKDISLNFTDNMIAKNFSKRFKNFVKYVNGKSY